MMATHDNQVATTITRSGLLATSLASLVVRSGPAHAPRGASSSHHGLGEAHRAGGGTRLDPHPSFHPSTHQLRRSIHGHPGEATRRSRGHRDRHKNSPLEPCWPSKEGPQIGTASPPGISTWHLHPALSIERPHQRWVRAVGHSGSWARDPPTGRGIHQRLIDFRLD